jgi:hypothetical protein
VRSVLHLTDGDDGKDEMNGEEGDGDCGNDNSVITAKKKDKTM